MKWKPYTYFSSHAAAATYFLFLLLPLPYDFYANLIIIIIVTIHEAYVAWHVDGLITQMYLTFLDCMWCDDFHSVQLYKLWLAAVLCITKSLKQSTEQANTAPQWNHKGKIHYSMYIPAEISKFGRCCVSRQRNRKVSFWSTVAWGLQLY